MFPIKHWKHWIEKLKCRTMLIYFPCKIFQVAISVEFMRSSNSSEVHNQLLTCIFWHFCLQWTRSPMALLREFLLWVVLGMIFVSLVIGLIFVFINKCISKKGMFFQWCYYTEQKYKCNIYHVSWAEIKCPRKCPNAQKAYFSQMLCTNLYTSLLVSISYLPR